MDAGRSVDLPDQTGYTVAMRTGWHLLVLTLGCTSTEPDATESLHSAPPADAAVALASMADPIARLAALEGLLEAHPERAGALCPLLSEPAMHKRCMTVLQRPHLWSPHQTTKVGTRAAPGPAQTFMLPTSLPDPFATLTGKAPRVCPPDLDATACAAARALEAATQRDTTRTAMLCRSIDAPRWRQECMFAAAEKRLKSERPGGYGDAVDLCAASGDFAADCLIHLTSTLAHDPPPATSTAAGWVLMLKSAEVVDEYWQSRDPAYGSLAAGRLWSEALQDAYSISAEVVGNPLDILPDQARPHIHAAAALRLIRQAPDALPTLAQWSQALDTALERRIWQDAPTQPAGRTARYPDLWPRDLPGEQDIPAVIYPSSSRRAVSDDPLIDRQIALLEALARVNPMRRAILLEATEHPDSTVRWSAQRLLERRSL
ncbi:MAG: hypothetical protein ACI8RZ_002213 [Myxococcota bacterium]